MVNEMGLNTTKIQFPLVRPYINQNIPASIKEMINFGSIDPGDFVFSISLI